MVNFKYLEWKLHFAAIALPFLFAKKNVLVLTIGNGCVDVGSLWRIGTRRNQAVVKQPTH